jgi:hypothetical protein
MMPPTTAAAATSATIRPVPPPSLFSFLRTTAVRLTFEAAVDLAAGAAAAITGALTKDAAEIAAREILPKRIIELLIFNFVHNTCHSYYTKILILQALNHNQYVKIPILL